MSHFRKKAGIRQAHSVNSNLKQWQPEEDQALYKKSFELEQFRTLYESIPCICFTLNPAGQILAVSHYGAACLGYNAAELTQQSVASVFYLEDKANCQAKLTGLQQEPTQIKEWEVRLVRKNGSILWAKAIARWVSQTRSAPIISLVCEDITDSLLRFEALRESEELHRITLSNISDTVFITNNIGDFTFIGSNVEVIFGYSWQEARKMGNIAALLGEPLLDWQELETCREIQNIEREITDNRGRRHTLLINVKRVSINEGTVLYICRDISDRLWRCPLGNRLWRCGECGNVKQTEEALRNSEKRFRLLAENSTDIISQHTPEGIYLYVSPACRTLLGYEPKDLIGHSAYEYFHPDDLAAIRKTHATILELPTTDTVAYRIRRQDGRYIWFETTTRTIRDSKTGEVLEIQSSSRDITDRKLAEEALRLSEARFRASVEGSLDSFFVFQSLRDETGRIEDFIFVDLNSNGEKLISMSKEDVIGKRLCELLPINRTEGFFEKYVRVVETGEVLEEEFPICVAGVNASWLHHQVVPLTDGIAIITRNITDRKQAEEALRQQVLKEQLLRALAGRIHKSLNLEEILNTTVAEVRQFLGCDRTIIFRLNCDGSGFVVVESVDSDWMSIAGTVINDRHFAQSYIQLYQQGRVQAVEDIYNAGMTRCHIDLLENFQVRANLVVPIVYEEQLWGLLVAQQCSETRQWQPLEIDLLKSLSTQAAIAIQQSELYQQAQTEILQRQQAEEALRQQFQRERLIGAIAGRIRRSLKLEKILNATVAEVRQVLQTDRVVIFRFEPDWSGNVVVESVVSGRFSILGKNIYDPCFKNAYVVPYQQGRVRAIDDIYTAKLSPCHIDLLEKIEVRANLIVPLLKQQQLWGLLVAHHCTEPRQWQQGEIDLLSAVAAQAGIAIQHSQLYEQTKSHFLREQLLNQLTQAIRSSLDLETIFATAVREIGSLLNVDHALIVQYLPEQKLWLNVSEYRKSNDLPAALGTKIPDENNDIADQLKRLEIVKIHDADTCEDEINQRFAETFPGAWLLVPLHFGSSVWGSLSLVKNIRPYQWQDWEVELMRAVADQVAIALQQAELYQQSRTATAQARTQAQQLEQAFIELQKTQTQLVQSEKMSSLGQLVAGVAHEINNPVSFIYGNLVHASGYTNDLLGLVQLYQQHYPNPVPEISSEIEEIDLEFLMEDLPKLLSSMKVGAERICEIVSALRNFSRLAEAEVKAVDLHEGLDSTLMILHNRLKASGKHPEIKVIKEYGNLPLVECYAGQLNQVFMNLLVNAIDAIDEQIQMRTSEEGAALMPEEIQANPSLIRVRTELLNDREVTIRIADNGPGMTEEIKARLFDPFFTTKAVGTGTGLGLSISYQIVVEKHGGQLHCYSQLGQGTEFVIQIPRSQEDTSAHR